VKARRLIESAAFEPSTLAVIFKAFDAAWREIAHHFPDDDEHARLRLGHAVLAVAREDSTDAEQVKRDALQVMALAYRGGPRGT
jgi:hypothetical protein